MEKAENPLDPYKVVGDPEAQGNQAVLEEARRDS